MNVVSAEIGDVDASTIAIVFSEKAGASHFIDGWIVRVNGAEVSISNAQLQADQKTLYLTIPECVSTDAITLQYVTQVSQTSEQAKMKMLDNWTPPDWNAR